jgi:hypothetical protein
MNDAGTLLNLAPVETLVLYSSREKIDKKNEKTFRMSRKIDAASRGAELISRERRIRWKSYMVRPAKISSPSTE